MFESVILMGGLGLMIGSALALASKVFYVYVDPKVEAIDEILPGANCGGCGFPGCTPNAEAIVEGKSGVDSCVAAGEDVAVAIAGIMGVTVSEKEPEIAAVDCHYSIDKTDIKYDYKGITDCRAANQLFGGMKLCKIGCLGLGTCVEACPFDAIEIGSDGLPKVDEEKCTACGTCVRACPKNIINLTSASRRIMVEYTEDNCVTPCQRACPAGIDVREYIRLAREGDYEGSVRKIMERNPFPTVIGRICPAFCEFECRRTLVDDPVAINNLKRFVCDYQIRKNKRVKPYKAPPSGKRVCVIGGGVEGLSAAYFCVRLGHEATVFDANANPGGLLRYAFPGYRLPGKIVDWDINGIQEAGVSIKTGLKAGHEVTVPGLLKDGYDAVFTATGGWDSRVTRGAVKGVSNVFPGGYLLIDL
ncbi:MAG: RnfABCDGE type electron transport complex subunit B, partial [Thermodesulfobacteriota bacterium]